MGSRLLITGVQLGMLIGIEDLEDRKELAEKIEKKQYIGYSDKDIEYDCKKAIKLRMFNLDSKGEK